MAEKVLIIGSGPAGFTAAIYASRANLNPLMLTGVPLESGGGVLGGQLTTTTEVENYPGFAEGVMGPELMMAMQKQAERFGTRVEMDHVVSVDLSKRPYTVKTVSEKTIQAETLIISTGASAKYLGLPSEKKLLGHGVSACATCDGFFFKGKRIVVVGGGDTAMEEASYLTKFASELFLVHRRPHFRASAVMLKRVQENPKIKMMTPFQVVEVQGGDKVTGVVLENSETKARQELACDGFFLAIGHQPNTQPFPDLDKDGAGYLVTDARTRALKAGKPVPGVYAAGDVMDPHYRQAVTAAGTGCAAAIEAMRFLEAEGA